MKSRNLGGVLVVGLVAGWLLTSGPRPTVHKIHAGMFGGSGVSVATARGQTLVLTANHVVKDGGPYTVNGKPAVLVATDSEWDLAALVVNETLPVSRLSKHFPLINDTLTICGYGTGTYREATGQVVGYATADQIYMDWAHINKDARSGDSGGPMFYPDNTVGAILWGSDNVGAYGTQCLRVRDFLATIKGYDSLLKTLDLDYTIWGR